MSHRILLTGVSGYLGGSLLAAMPNADLPPFDKLYALVRTGDQAEAVKRYGAEPLSFDPHDEAAVRKGVLDHGINVVFYLIDAFKSTGQANFIKALGELKKTTGREVHFLHTSGAKIFSSHAGFPTDTPFPDNAPDLFSTHNSQTAPLPLMQTPIATNLLTTTLSATHSVHSYILIPCIVYGRGTGFGNTISIQTVAIVRAALACRRAWAVDADKPAWPVCHVDDTTSLYLALLSAILASKPPPPPQGEKGYYLAASGSVRWWDLYAAMARALKVKGLVDSEVVERADDEATEQMAKGLGCDKGMVALQLGGECRLEARNAEENLGWKPRYRPEHVLETAGEEVDLILEGLRQKGEGN